KENDVNKALDLLKQQGVKESGDSSGMQGIHDFLEQVRRLKQKLQDSMGASNPAAMEELKRLEKLEHELRRASWGLDLEKIDAQQIQDLMGEQSYELWNQIKAIPRLLELKGYIEKLGARFELTPKGMRKIGQRALQDIFTSLTRDALGTHQTKLRGNGVTHMLEESKAYRFGDPFHLNLGRTLMNSLGRKPRRRAPAKGGRLLHLSPEDFEVYQTEKRTRSTIVLMLDMSGSMARDEKFFAAKKVALALHTLIKTQFPRDRLYLVGFSSYARALKSKDLPSLNWDLDNPYTNMEEGLVLAKTFLNREHAPNKQIIMISDGEPTAHRENGKVFFQFPPHPRTLAKTILEFKKCANRGISLNIFMLGQDAHLVQFVQEISKVNHGRAFYTTPQNLGQYLFVDFLAQKRKWIRT
ncbi:MAG TPA: VWA domain-containing protein, partial [Thermodesulfobacteriota bacterium]|nr:VWA domain-containing protein [Thermodesulfobacteriota bacterium]